MNEPRFDLHAFAGKKNRPVSKETGLTYEDYASMSTHQRKPSGERRLTTPVWAVNDKLLQELLTVFMEERAMIGRGTGSLVDRLERARKSLLARKPDQESTLERMCADYLDLKKNGFRMSCKDSDLPGEALHFDESAAPYFSNYQQRSLQINIEGMDTFLRTNVNGGVEVFAAIVYLYYRACLDSVGVGEALHIKPPHVRQVLWRLHRCWKKFFVNHETTAVTAA